MDGGTAMLVGVMLFILGLISGFTSGYLLGRWGR